MNFGGTIRLNKCGLCIVTGLLFLLILYVASSYKNDSEKGNKIKLKKLLIASIEAAVKGGKEVIDVHSGSNLNIKAKGKTKEGDDDLVTNADKKSNCAMYHSLCHTYPNVKVESEEDSPESDCRTLQTLELDPNVLHTASELADDEEVVDSDITVWIDPLDATKEFTEDLLQYVTTMVCIAVKGEPVIGVIHFPFGEEPRTTWAWVGKGISDEILKKSKSQTMEENNLKVTISRSHSGEVVKVVRAALGETVDIVQAGGAGYKTLEVASKNVSAYIHTNVIKKWDICAGNAIIKALGGEMTTLKGEKINYESSSSKDDAVNSNGLLVTLMKHDWFLAKLISASSAS